MSQVIAVALRIRIPFLTRLATKACLRFLSSAFVLQFLADEVIDQRDKSLNQYLWKNTSVYLKKEKRKYNSQSDMCFQNNNLTGS